MNDRHDTQSFHQGFNVAAVHAPVGQQSGLPVPLGFASFDQRVLASASQLLEATADAYNFGSELKKNLNVTMPPDGIEETIES